MPQHLLEMTDRRAVLEHVRGAGMAKAVRGDVLINTGKIGAGFHHAPDPAAVHPAAPTVQDQVAAIICFADKCLVVQTADSFTDQFAHPFG